MNIPNTLTLLRLACAPLLVLLFYVPFSWGRPACVVILILAALTDWLDGYLARRWQQTSRIGVILDPMADKLVICVSLILLVGADGSPWLVIPSTVIIFREILITTLRELIARLAQHSQIAVSKTAKYKLTLQTVAVITMMYQHPLFNVSMYWFGLWLLYLAMLITLWTMVSYLRTAWMILADERVATALPADGHPPAPKNVSTPERSR